MPPAVWLGWIAASECNRKVCFYCLAYYSLPVAGDIQSNANALLKNHVPVR